jgi:aspartate/methionine/tyrosine aminotransferase
MKLATITLADRATDGENAIRQRFAQQDQIDAELKNAGCNETIKLSIGQPHLPPSPIEKMVYQDLANGTDVLPLGYSPSKGRPEYVRYATQLFNARNPGLDAKDENVLLTIGGTGALAALAAATLQPGRKVLFPVPGFAAQLPALKGYGAEVIQVPTHDTAYKLSAARLEEMLQAHPETAFVVLNDITNPTGAKYSEAELKSLGDVFRKHPNVLIFCDETYHDLALDPDAKFFVNVNPDLKGQTVIEYSTAKDLGGDPALRGGMVYAPKVQANGQPVSLAEKMAGQQLNMITAAPTIIQHMMARIIEAKLDKHYDGKEWQPGGRAHQEQQRWEAHIKEQYRQNLTIARQAFRDAGMQTLVEPGGGFFLLIDASRFINRKIPDSVTSYNGLKITNLHQRVGSDTLDTDIKVATYLAQVANMVMVEASPFGMPPEIGALRVSVANTPEKLKVIPARILHAERSLIPEIKLPAQVSSRSPGAIIANGSRQLGHSNAGQSSSMRF